MENSPSTGAAGAENQTGAAGAETKGASRAMQLRAVRGLQQRLGRIGRMFRSRRLSIEECSPELGAIVEHVERLEARANERRTALRARRGHASTPAKASTRRATR